MEGVATKQKKINLVTCFIVAIVLWAITDGYVIPLLVYRICYQSTSTYVPSQCVNCPYFGLQGYSFSCVGSTGFPRNITPAQAQCIIQRCQDGIRQTPVYLGRKRRAPKEDTLREREIRTLNSQSSPTDTLKNIEYLNERTPESAVREQAERSMQIVGEIDAFVMDDDYEFEDAVF